VFYVGYQPGSFSLETAVDVPKTKTSYFLARICIESLYVDTRAGRYAVTQYIGMLIALFICFRVTLIFSLASRTWRSFKVLERHVVRVISFNLKKVIGRSTGWWVWVPVYSITVFTSVCFWTAIFSRPLYSIY